MTLRHMKIFLSVCENGTNTTKAAAALHMTQPAVSLAIKELEQYYGVVLFDRIGRRLKITEAGQQFREYAAHICQMFDTLEKGMRDWDTVGILRVGASITIGSQFLPSYVKAFTENHPGTQVRVIVAPYENLEKKLLNNELDFVLAEAVPHHMSLIAQPYMEDRLTIIAPADAGFSPWQPLSVERFAQQDFLLREPGSGTRDLFDQVTRQAGFSVTPIWESVSTTALVNAVVSGLGISVLPYRMVENALNSGLVIPIRAEGLDFIRHFHIIYHREKYLTGSARAFLELCRSYERDHPASEPSEYPTNP